MMSDCERIEAGIGRELSVMEMCACGELLLSGATEAQIIRDLKAKDIQERIRARAGAAGHEVFFGIC